MDQGKFKIIYLYISNFKLFIQYNVFLQEHYQEVADRCIPPLSHLYLATKIHVI